MADLSTGGTTAKGHAATVPAEPTWHTGHSLQLVVEYGRLAGEVVCPHDGRDWSDVPWAERPPCRRAYTEDGEPETDPWSGGDECQPVLYAGADMVGPEGAVIVEVPVEYGWDDHAVRLRPAVGEARAEVSAIIATADDPGDMLDDIAALVVTGPHGAPAGPVLGEDARQALIDARLPSSLETMPDGYLSVCLRTEAEAADLALSVLAPHVAALVGAAQQRGYAAGQREAGVLSPGEAARAAAVTDAWMAKHTRTEDGEYQP